MLLLGITRFKCPSCGVEAQLPRGTHFNCPNCGVALICNSTFTIGIVTIFGGIPMALGAAFGDVGAVVGGIASVAFVLGLWRATFRLRLEGGGGDAV